MEPSLALQRAVFDRLRTDAALTALVPAANIFDRHGLPSASPCLILGDDQTIREPIALADRSFRVAVALHVWVKGQNLVPVKQIAGAVMLALRPRFASVTGFRVVSFLASDARYLRDPGGEWGHGVLGYEALLVEVMP